MVKFLICFAIFHTPLISAAMITDENLCKKLHEQKKAMSFEEKLNFLKSGLKLRFQKSKFARPEILSLDVDPKNLISKPENHIEDDHLVFILGVDQTQEISDSVFEEEIKRYSELKKTIKKQEKKLRQLARSRSTKSCRKKQKAFNFSWKNWEELHEEKNSLHWARRHDEHLQAQKIATKTLKDLKLPWHMIENESLENMHHILRSTKSKHVVFMTHGRDLGEIFDRCDSACPPTFFENLSPSIQSLSLFVCHSQKAVDFYNLEKMMTESPSYYDQRYIFSLKNNKIYGYENIAPLLLFKHFLRKVDHFLAKKSEFLNPVEGHLQESAPSCLLSTKGLNLKAGTVSITLNRHFIGSWEAPKTTDQILEFPCPLLKKGHRFIFDNARLHEQLELDPNFEVSITDSDGSQRLCKEKRFIPDGSENPRRIIFSL